MVEATMWWLRIEQEAKTCHTDGWQQYKGGLEYGEDFKDNYMFVCAYAYVCFAAT